MKYIVEKSVVRVIGKIWQPGIEMCAMEYNLDSHDIENICQGYRDNKEILQVWDWRSEVESWLSTHSGDFQTISDFYASLEIDGKTVEIGWKGEESEMIYNQCLFYAEGD